MGALACRLTLVIPLLLVRCDATGFALPEMHERLCNDDEDDDLDGRKDCTDPDCAASYWCLNHSGGCHAERAIGCGQTMSGDTTDGVSTIPGWGCGEETPGPEQLVSFLSPIDGEVTVTTSAGTLIAVEGDVKGCNPDLCVSDGEGQVETFVAEKGRTYWFAVDGEAPVAYSLSVSCEGGIVGEGLCADGEDGDGDGKFDCNDPDCATAPWCPGAVATSCEASGKLACGETKFVESQERHLDGYRCTPLQLPFDAPGPDTVLRLDVPVSGTYDLYSTEQSSLVLLRGQCASTACHDHASKMTVDLQAGEPVFVVVEGGKGDAAPSVTLACPAMPKDTGSCAVTGVLGCGQATVVPADPEGPTLEACGAEPVTVATPAWAVFTADRSLELAALLDGGEGVLVRASPSGACAPAQCVDQGAQLRATLEQGESVYVATTQGATVHAVCGEAGKPPQTCPTATPITCGASVTVTPSPSSLEAYRCGADVDGGFAGPEAAVSFNASEDVTVEFTASDGTLFLLGSACDAASCLDSGSPKADVAKGETVTLVADSKKTLGDVTFTAKCTPSGK